MKEAEFITRVQALGGLPTPKEAKRWTIEVLRALTDVPAEAEVRRRFVSQLPGGLKSRLRRQPARDLATERGALVQHVAATLGVHAAEGERALRIVFRVLKETLSPGQIAQFEAHVPKDVAVLLEKKE